MNGFCAQGLPSPGRISYLPDRSSSETEGILVSRALHTAAVNQYAASSKRGRRRYNLSSGGSALVATHRPIMNTINSSPQTTITLTYPCNSLQIWNVNDFRQPPAKHQLERRDHPSRLELTELTELIERLTDGNGFSGTNVVAQVWHSLTPTF